MTKITYLKFLLVILLLSTSITCRSQQSLNKKIDSLFSSQAEKPFNGVVVLSKNGKVKYNYHSGFADVEDKKLLKPDQQFILGSISKQFTAVLVLQEFDKGRLDLQDPIGKFLPELPKQWKDSITIHQLLNHTSGIVGLNKPLEFTPGTKFSYSPTLTYSLLQRIIEKTSGKKFNVLATQLFKECRMGNTVTTGSFRNGNLTCSYIQKTDGNLQKRIIDFSDSDDWMAGAGIISTAKDLIKWNKYLHNGKLLSKSTYQLMVTPSSHRNHPLWGQIGYGYGIQIDYSNGTVELGHAGYIGGYNTLNFYYPETKTSIIVLANIDWHQKFFFYHKSILELARKNSLIEKN